MNKLDKHLKNVPFSYMWILRNSMGDAKTVLDLGTADGALMALISSDENWKITGVDIYYSWIKIARKSGVYNKLIKGDLNTVCKKLIKDKVKFDVVFCSQTIEHISRKKGEELLELSEKLAKNKIVFGTPKGYMEQPEEFLGDNPYQKHKSGWSEADFRARGYNVYGIGFAPIWTETGLARTRSKLMFYVYTVISFLMAPLVYFSPALAAGILCIKDIKNEKNK